MEKRAKGLCFTCDEKWSHNHHCKNKRELNVILGPGEVEVETGEEEDRNEEEAPLTMAVISLSSVVGISHPQTMRMKGEIHGQEVVVMVDSGATNNFISASAVSRLLLEPTEGDRYGVILGNGEKIYGTGKCQKLLMNIQGVEIVEDYLILGLGSTDIILGMQWLEKLGEVVTNWKQQVMKFFWEGEERTLKGDPSLERSKTT